MNILVLCSVRRVLYVTHIHTSIYTQTEHLFAANEQSNISYWAKLAEETYRSVWFPIYIPTFFAFARHYTVSAKNSDFLVHFHRPFSPHLYSGKSKLRFYTIWPHGPGTFLRPLPQNSDRIYGEKTPFPQRGFHCKIQGNLLNQFSYILIFIVLFQSFATHGSFKYNIFEDSSGGKGALFTLK